MKFGELVQPIIDGREMETAHAAELMAYLISGEATDAQIGAVIVGLRVKGCTPSELAEFARVMRATGATVEHAFDDLVDTCGTGGGLPTFNISTAAAIVAAAAGVRIAKHGNRSMTGLGSADLLEALGVPVLDPNPEAGMKRILRQLGDIGIAFMFAPAHHPAMRHVAKARKELGVRTVFNQLGPLANPAGAKKQLIGVYDATLLNGMATALQILGSERAMLVHGLEGLDEISPCGPTEVVELQDGVVNKYTLEPCDFGLDPLPPSALEAGADIAGNAKILEEAISDRESLRCRAILPSAAAAIYVSGLEGDLKAGVAAAEEAIVSGSAVRKLEQMRQGGSA
jgi:anthranilate phosphoribosyltransferase